MFVGALGLVASVGTVDAKLGNGSVNSTDAEEQLVGAEGQIEIGQVTVHMRGDEVRRRRPRLRSRRLQHKGMGRPVSLGDDSDPGLSGAAASGPPVERSDADLMLEALKATRGESPNAARIDRVVAETSIESKRKQPAILAASFWKDPFLDDADPPVLVRARRQAKYAGERGAGRPADVRAELLAARRESARARAEAAASRAEAAAAHVDALASKRAAEEARVGCVDKPLLRQSVALRNGARLQPGVQGPRRHLRKPSRTGSWRGPSRGTTILALSGRGLSARGLSARTFTPGQSAGDDGALSVGPGEAPGSSVVSAVPSQPATASYRGILVVPIDSRLPR